MKDQFRTNQELLEEISALKHKIQELEQSEPEYQQTEQALHESEDLFRSYIEEAPDGIYMNDLEGNFLYSNRKCEDIIGYRREELIGKNFLELNLLSENSLNKAAQLLQANIEGKSTGPDKIELINKDGRLIPVEVSSSVVQRMGQGIVLAFVRDITDRKQAEEELRESEEKWRTIITTSPDGIAICSMDGYTEEVSGSVLKMFGYTSVEELMGKQIFDFIDPSYHEKAIHLTGEMLNGNYTGLGEYLAVKKDGTRFFIEANTEILRNAQGESTNIIFIMRDITERKRAEEVVLQSEKHYRLLADNVSDVIWTVNMDMQLLYVTPSVKNLLGFTEEEMMVRTMQQIFTPAALEKAMLFLAEELEIENAGQGDITRSRKVEMELVSKDGNIVPVEGNYSFLRDLTGKATGILAIVRDITERKSMEEKINALAITDILTGLYNRRGFIALAKQQLKTASRSKKQMLLVFIDIDGMKWINDTLGHEQGDKALIEATNVLKQTFRESDIIARFGGDEFAILAVDAADMNTETFSKRLQQYMDDCNTKESRQYKLAMSWGAAIYNPDSPMLLDKLISEADKLMYINKKTNNNI